MYSSTRLFLEMRNHMSISMPISVLNHVIEQIESWFDNRRAETGEIQFSKFGLVATSIKKPNIYTLLLTDKKDWPAVIVFSREFVIEDEKFDDAKHGLSDMALIGIKTLHTRLFNAAFEKISDRGVIYSKLLDKANLDSSAYFTDNIYYADDNRVSIRLKSPNCKLPSFYKASAADSELYFENKLVLSTKLKLTAEITSREDSAVRGKTVLVDLA